MSPNWNQVFIGGIGTEGEGWEAFFVAQEIVDSRTDLPSCSLPSITRLSEKLSPSVTSIGEEAH